MACKVENCIEVGSLMRVETVGGPHRDTPSGKHPQVSMYFLPTPCMHCGEPPCVDACPVGAIYKREDGIVLIDEDKCDGCQACIPTCPYDALLYDSEREVVQKCTLCAHRVDQGLEPFCVICCETEAIFFGDFGDPTSRLSKLIAERGAVTLTPEAATKPAIYYCPTKQGLVEKASVCYISE